jgi:hypothetical protein
MRHQRPLAVMSKIEGCVSRCGPTIINHSQWQTHNMCPNREAEVVETRTRECPGVFKYEAIFEINKY